MKKIRVYAEQKVKDRKGIISPRVKMEDLTSSIERVKPINGPKMIKKYEDWRSQYGNE
jgi:hypothetical protein